MRFTCLHCLKLSFLFVAFLSTHLAAKEYLVETPKDYEDIASHVVAGDRIVLKNGTWTDFEILLKGKGTEASPITLTAETKGKVILSGQSNLRLAGEHLVVSGLVFKDGYTPSSAVVEFRQNKDEFAYHSRVTEIVIDNYSNPDKRESDYWIALYGQHNRFDHNHLVGKRNKGVTVAVRLNSEQSQQNHHKIDHNYFGYRPTFGSNGGETLRIGTSHFSLTDSFTLVENNFFEQTNGEVEIISVKSGKNVLRGNVFVEARGTLTLRHGNGNIIENNIFLGNGVDHTGGIRIINKDHIIRNNYMEGLTGFRFGSGFTVMNGVPNSPINRYHQVDNVLIENNTMANVRHIQLAAGSDAERSAAPVNSIMRNNLIFNQDGQQPFTIFDDVSGVAVEGNVANTQVVKDIQNGFSKKKLSAKRNKNGLLSVKGRGLKSVGVDKSLSVLDKSATGVTWYPKVPATVAFDSGKTYQVAANPKALQSAIEQAQDGDVLELLAGEYTIPKLLIIDKTLTLKAQEAETVKLSYERSTLFEIHDGGNLMLSGLVISGESSPDSAGNSVVRTKKWGMVDNYRFVMTDSRLVDLNINHSFHFFVTGKGAFADEIVLKNNVFETVTGDIVRLNTEIEDLGIYNAEYLTLQSNTFNSVEGALVKMYRGGTDESTFGPHLFMTDNTLNNVGNGRRNKEASSVYLHGVQVTNMEDNNWLNSAPVIVEHTVGQPKTAIVNNVFDATKPPAVEELFTKGPQTALLENNAVKNALTK
jgi:poly(beta-D-mannuronate) lyase